MAQAASTQIVFEAPHRIESLAADLAAACPDRPITVCRELTKQFETIATMTARTLPAGSRQTRSAGAASSWSSCTRSLHEPPSRRPTRTMRCSRRLIAALPLKQAVALAGEITGAARNALYARALALKSSRESAGPPHDGPG